MNSFKIGLFFLFFIFLNCGKAEKNKAIIKNDNLINYVRLAINPKYQDWVLFENGTYIIFDNADTISDIKNQSVKLLKEFGPVFAGSSAGDFDVIHLNKTKGWIVSGHGYGIYTYVSPDEIEYKEPTDIEIGLLGRSKRDLDAKNRVIIYVNRKIK
ncbi:hypothetical protein OX283_013450 [Flavobacterium sp. SUN052]|uniref:hypothetical protein n=1 Tax=Flavobacterium sp. SUN052 TaxID=3002441 RepID=UPI00237E97B0|nr:hypothetical protein [Flavobacterium sp. SUN052]MEC4005670.1 hypothetical protein [Flavobacterium sp. SUN052]